MHIERLRAVGVGAGGGRSVALTAPATLSFLWLACREWGLDVMQQSEAVLALLRREELALAIVWR